MIIISRHPGAVEWLRRRGIEGHVVEHATEEDVRNEIVVGNLPLHLAVLARQVWIIELPDLPREARGRDLTPEEMDQYGARLRRYVVRALDEKGASYES